MRVVILHNVADSPSRWIGGYKDGQPLVPVYAYDVDDDIAARDVFAVAGDAFRIFNVGDDPAFGTPDERALDYRQRKNRSLSVGDVVKIGECWLSCESIGWRALVESPADCIIRRTSYGTTTWEGTV